MAAEDYKTTIKIEGDAKGATGAIASTSKSLRGLLAPLTALRAAISNVMRAFGIFYLAVEGIRKIHEGIKLLSSYMEELRTRVERAAFADKVAKTTTETNRLVSAQKQLNDQLKEQLSLLQKTSSLRELSRQGAKTFSDEQRNVDRAVELAGVTDPRQRQAVEDRYAREDEARRRAERGQDLSGRIGQLTSEADAYSATAARARQLRDETSGQIEAELGILAGQKAMKASEEEMEATRKRIAALSATRAAALQEQKTAEEEAAYRRSQIQILQKQQKDIEQLGSSIEQVQAAAWKKIDDADAEATRRLSEKLSANEAVDKWERDFAKATPAAKISMLQDKESGARGRMESLQSELDVEMGKAVADRDQARMADLRSGIESAQGEMFAARRQREGLEEEAIGQRQSVTLGAGSRLNAMGLGAGSGVARVQEQMANSLRDLVRLAREQVAAIKDIGSEDGGAAVFQ